MEIGYDQEGFSERASSVESNLHAQSTDIAMGVDPKIIKTKELVIKGMFGYACKETEDLMPAQYFTLANLRLMAEDRKTGKLVGIEPDSKSQVTMKYENFKPTKVTRL